MKRDSHKYEGFKKTLAKKEILTYNHKRFTQLKIGVCNLKKIGKNNSP